MTIVVHALIQEVIAKTLARVSPIFAEVRCVNVPTLVALLSKCAPRAPILGINFHTLRAKV